MSDKIEIVLDADVIIHFSQGGYLHLLPKVIPDCSFVVLRARGPYFGRKVLKSSVLDMMFEFKESYDNFMR